MTSEWRPTHGMTPSPKETRVLSAALRLENQRTDAYGPTLSQLFSYVKRRWPEWSPARSTVRAHLKNLELKGHIEPFDRRHVKGELTFQVTDRGELFVLRLRAWRHDVRGYHPWHFNVFRGAYEDYAPA